MYHLLCGKQPLFPTTGTKFQVKRRMKGRWVQAADLYVIIIFFESIVKNTLENPGREFHFTFGHPEREKYSLIVLLLHFLMSASKNTEIKQEFKILSILNLALS